MHLASVGGLRMRVLVAGRWLEWAMIPESQWKIGQAMNTMEGSQVVSKVAICIGAWIVTLCQRRVRRKGSRCEQRLLFAVDGWSQVAYSGHLRFCAPVYRNLPPFV